MLLIQSLPLIVLVLLLASGRVGPIWSCVAALLCALPAAWLGLADRSHFAGFLGHSLLEGLWLAAIPVGIICAGLVFHAGVDPANAAANTPARAVTADVAFDSSFLLGMFTEAATGFGVGTVFAVGALKRLGLIGAPAAAIGLMAQLGIPWGGLGPGTAIGAALAGVDVQQMSLRNAEILAPSFLMLLPLFWWWCGKLGLLTTGRDRMRQFCWLALLGGLLIGGHFVLPWQLCGMMASGTVLSLRLLIAQPPRNADDFSRMGRSAFPYLLLAGLLLASQLWHNAPALRPFPGLPILALNHAMVSICVAALVLFIRAGKSPLLAWAALKRARRPATALLGFVVLARVLANAGIPVALASALVASFGAAAPFASPILAAIAGFFAGTNVGGNSAMMPLQAALGRASGLGPLVLPGIQNGTLALVISPQLTSVAAGLMGGGVTPAKLWRIMWPVALVGLIAGSVSILIG
ncbi:MAG: L-lactate permease [Acetobacteraceae bacterium]|nr:L-lactate permease [Acetobacteraceae bacterium]